AIVKPSTDARAPGMLHDGYRVTAEHEDAHWWFRARREVFLAQVERAAAARGAPARQLRLLDYGCRTRLHLRSLAAFGEVRGAEPGEVVPPEFRRAAGERILDLDTDCSAHDGRFDVLTALDVLEHLDDDVAGLAHMRRFLAPGGQMVLTVPDYAWLWSGEAVIRRHRRRSTGRAVVAAAGR